MRQDDLKKISGVVDGIIFDDMDFNDWSPEEILALLDWDEPRSLPARYNDAFVDAGPRVAKWPPLGRHRAAPPPPRVVLSGSRLPSVPRGATEPPGSLPEAVGSPRGLPKLAHFALFLALTWQADIPMIFTTNKKPKYIFPMEKASHEQKKAIKRRYDEVKIDAPLQALGRPLTGPEKRARKEAGRDGPQGPPAI